MARVPPEIAIEIMDPFHDRRKLWPLRPSILEDELLSIHSCAIVWEAVVVCHYLALEGGLEHYTERLASHATKVGQNVFSIHRWLRGEQPNIALHPTAAA